MVVHVHENSDVALNLDRGLHRCLNVASKRRSGGLRLHHCDTRKPRPKRWLQFAQLFSPLAPRLQGSQPAADPVSSCLVPYAKMHHAIDTHLIYGCVDQELSKGSGHKIAQVDPGRLSRFCAKTSMLDLELHFSDLKYDHFRVNDRYGGFISPERRLRAYYVQTTTGKRSED